LSHDLGLSVVAEGVETREVLDPLQVLGCDRVQGFFFSEPLECDELLTWLDTPQLRSVRAA
jgi:EAL domain-containing protein (putative c-di-GMP-specific phosphodiesterase class I)